MILWFLTVLQGTREASNKQAYLTPKATSKRVPEKKKAYISALLNMPKPLTVWITINFGKLFKRWEYQTT